MIWTPEIYLPSRLERDREMRAQQLREDRRRHESQHRRERTPEIRAERRRSARALFDQALWEDRI